MALIIRELVITAEVGGGSQEGGSSGGGEDKRQMVEECVEQVLEILRERSER